mmetsp:Transcript_17490/g.26554  ORF Transcript_17490/g.26554 Transcript_17490/m.26554 type:complete len:267 (+) Transcript_17490:81-881(+)
MVEEDEIFSEEEQLLRDMILDRDRTIDKLQRRTSKLEQKIVDVAERTRNTANNVAETQVSQISVKKQLNDKVSLCKQRIDALEKDMLKQNGGLHLYAQSIQEIAPQTKESSYVLRVQSQLCKAMHSMGIFGSQLETVKKQSEARIAKTKATLHDLIESKTQMEVEIMNQLMKIDDENKQLQDALEKSKTKIEEVQESVLSRDSSYEGDSEESEEEDEDEIDEDLLQELVDERKVLIAELEGKNMNQVKQIETLSEKIKCLDGERQI